MNILLLKLFLAPVIIGGASLAGRRWGPGVSGWLVGLPLTSGPVIFFVSISHPISFAASTALGTLSGGIALVTFCLVYSWLAIYFNWAVSITGSIFFYGLVTILMQNVILPLWIIFSLVVIFIFIGLQLMPKKTQLMVRESTPGKWDLPVRIFIGTSFIFGLTAIAPLIGPRLTGLLSTIPLYTAILAIFAHRLQGAAGAASLLRGLLFGLFGFSGFYLVLSLFLDPGRQVTPINGGIAAAFFAAVVTALLIQGLSFLFMKHTPT
ncbi:MAG: hypothetical protein WCP19_00010 [Chloroflexota bacterium]